MLKSKRRNSRALSALSLLFLMSSCLNPPAPGVGVNSVTADIIFGIPVPEEPVLPPNVNPVFPRSADPGPVPTGPARHKSTPSCPDATINEVDEPASVNVPKKPETGISRWKLKGKYRLTADVLVDLPTFTERAVFDVKPLEAAGDFTYSVLLQEGGAGRVFAYTFDVIQSHPAPSTALNAANEQSTQNGIFLRQITRFDEQGNATISELRPALTWLPLPVRPGVNFTTTASDPKTFTSITHRGRPVERRRLDACGQFVDSWFVDAEQTIVVDQTSDPTSDQDAGPTTYTLNFDYAVATQMGGVTVFEHFEAPCTYDAPDDAQSNANPNLACPDPTLSYDTNLGAIKPEPLPDDFSEQFS